MLESVSGVEIIKAVLEVARLELVDATVVLEMDSTSAAS